MKGEPITERQKQAAWIAEHPEHYKVCEGCFSILKSTAILCPVCHSYRSDSDRKRVIDQAVALGTSDHTVILLSDLQ